MKRCIALFVIIVFLISSLTGCATTTTGDKTATGAGVGAGLGAIIGAAAGGGWKGALLGAAIGAVVGGVAGYAIGKYEESQMQSTKQVYYQYPAYAEPSANLDPDIKELKPALMDKNNRPISSFKGGQSVKLVSQYTVVAPPEVENVNVEENNYLVMPDGTHTPDAIRTKPRKVESISAKQTVTLPKEIVPGTYQHVAIVKLNGKEYIKEQQIEVAKSGDVIKVYAVNFK